MADLKFKAAFKYPFNRATGMLNFLWILIPIIGWFALGGYLVRIIQEFIKGKYKQLPLFNFGEHLSLGFFMFLKSLPFLIAYTLISFILVLIHPSFEWLLKIIEILILPILSLNFTKKETVESFFEFGIVGAVMNNLKDYIIAFLKDIALVVVYLPLVIVLVGIPALTFTHGIFLTEFYRKNIK